VKISILCRLNQARSPFGQAVLEHFFPGFTFNSAGIDAVEYAEASAEVRLVAEDWNLPTLKPQSEGLLTRKDHIVNSDLVILAESSMDVPLRSLGFKGKSFPFNALKIDSSFIPIDPLGLPFRKLRLELAKVAYCSVQAMRIYLNKTSMNLISTVIPQSEADTAFAYAYSKLERQISGGVIIDADFRSPAVRHYSSELDIEYIDVANFKKVEIAKIGPRTVLAPGREYSNPESILLSHGWKNLLDTIRETMPIYIVSAPRQTDEKSLADPYLCAIWADNVIIINS